MSGHADSNSQDGKPREISRLPPSGNRRPYRRPSVRLRNAARAIIFFEDKILLTRNRGAKGNWYLFPGGGQLPAEELEATVRRECLEETGLVVKVGGLRFVREYIGAHHDFADKDAHVHQIEFYFECEPMPGEDVREATNVDNTQIGIEWVPIEDLTKINLFPKALRTRVGKPGPTYLGDCN